MTAKQIIHYITVAFSSLWIVFIMIDYLYYHPTFFQSIIDFQYLDLVLANFVIGAVIGYFVVNNKIKTKFSLSNGLGISLLFLLISGIIIKVQSNRLPTNTEILISDIGTYLGTVILISMSTYFVYLVCYCLGNFSMTRVFSLKKKQLEECLISIALGIILLGIFLFIAASFSMLTFIPVWIFFLLTPLLLWKHSLRFIKITFFDNLFKTERIGWLGYICLYIILFSVSLNILQNVRPFPFGFDALRLYMNLPKLLAERGEMVMGHSPYYWSLFISLGHILFNKVEVVLSLSSSGGILAAFSIYALSKKWLNRDFSLLVVLLFLSLPMVRFLSSSDVKDDLGLLFIHSIVFLLLVNYLEFPKYNTLPKEFIPNKKTAKKTKSSTSLLSMIEIQPKNALLYGRITEEIQLIILMGIISGGALGIKLTTLILIFSVVSILFFFKVGFVGFITSATLVFTFILLAGLDVASGLRAYHLGTHWLRWITLGLGLIGLIYLFYQHQKETLQLFKLCTIYGTIAILIYLPWPIKNYTETKSFSFQTFIQGKEVKPPPLE